MYSNISSSKTIAKNTMYMYIRMIVLMLVSLYTVRVIVNVLGVESYGLYSAVSGVVLTFSFLSTSLASSAQRFFSIDIGTKNENNISDTLSSICLSYLVLGIITVILLESCGLWFLMNKMTIPSDSICEAKFLYHFSISTFLVTIFTNPFYALIISYERMNIYAYMSLFEAFFKLLIAILLKYITFNKLKLYGVLLFAVSFIILLTYIIICKRLFPFIKIRPVKSFSKVKNIFSFSSWSLLGTFAGAANSQILNILLNVFYGPLANAAYAIGHQISGVLGQITNSFYSAVRPPLTKSYAINDWQSTERLFYFSSKIIFILLFLILVPLYVEIEFVLSLWLGHVDKYMVSFSRLLLINISIICLSNPITTIVQAAGAVKRYHIFVDGFVLLSLPIIFITLKKGLVPELSFVISNIFLIIAHIIRIILLKAHLTFSIRHYLISFILPISIIIVSDFIVSYVISNIICKEWLRVIVIVLTSTIVISTFSYYLLLSKRERILVKEKVSNIFTNKIYKFK